MNLHRRIGIPASLAVLLLGLVLVPSSVPLRAQPTAPPPDPNEFVQALWIAESGGVLKVAAADGTILFELGDAAGVRAMAVDDRQNQVWAYSSAGTLRAYTFSGALAVTVPLPPPTDSTDDPDTVALAVNPTTGAVALGVGPTFTQLDAHGQVLTRLPLAEAVVALAVDVVAGRTWVGTRHSLVARDASGQVVAAIDLGEDPDLRDLAVDAVSGALWVARGEPGPASLRCRGPLAGRGRPGPGRARGQ